MVFKAGVFLISRYSYTWKKLLKIIFKTNSYLQDFLNVIYNTYRFFRVFAMHIVSFLYRYSYDDD